MSDRIGCKQHESLLIEKCLHITDCDEHGLRIEGYGYTNAEIIALLTKARLQLTSPYLPSESELWQSTWTR